MLEMALTNLVATELSLSSVVARQIHRVSTLKPGEFNRRTLQFSTSSRKVKSGGGYVPFTVRSWKGHVTPPEEVMEHFKNGVIPSKMPGAKVVTRKDFPPDFKFGCSTSASQVTLSLLLILCCFIVI